jgi:hypothetical protein
MNPKKINIQFTIIKPGEENDVVPSTLYRYESDPSHMLRINQNYPREFSKTKRIIEEFECHVSGVTHYLENVHSFIAGNNLIIWPFEEPQPKFPHAIAIYGDWTDIDRNHQMKQLGHVPDDDAKAIYEIRQQENNIKLGVHLTTVFLPVYDLTAGLKFNIAVFGEPIPRFCVEGYSKTSGRKRKKHYWAKDIEEAIKFANADGMIVDIRSVKEISHNQPD